MSKKVSSHNVHVASPIVRYCVTRRERASWKIKGLFQMQRWNWKKFDKIISLYILEKVSKLFPLNKRLFTEWIYACSLYDVYGTQLSLFFDFPFLLLMLYIFDVWIPGISGIPCQNYTKSQVLIPSDSCTSVEHTPRCTRACIFIVLGLNLQ